MKTKASAFEKMLRKATGPKLLQHGSQLPIILWNDILKMIKTKENQYAFTSGTQLNLTGGETA